MRIDVVLAFAAAVNVSLARCAPSRPPADRHELIDGDALDLSDGRRVRVLGIDTPAKGECGFEEAREFARATLLDEEVARPTRRRTRSTGTGTRCCT
jgi:endonuclease YncB( thermonuclease family)